MLRIKITFGTSCDPRHTQFFGKRRRHKGNNKTEAFTLVTDMDDLIARHEKFKNILHFHHRVIQQVKDIPNQSMYALQNQCTV